MQVFMLCLRLLALFTLIKDSVLHSFFLLSNTSCYKKWEFNAEGNMIFYKSKYAQIGERKPLSKEILSKQTASVLSAVINQPHWKKDELSQRMIQVLNEIKQGVDSEEAYLETILRNVTFLIENTNRAIAFLKHCIDEEEFVPQETFHALMLDIPRQVNESNFFAENMPRFKEMVYKGSTKEEQAANAELVYCNIRLVNDLLIDFIGTFLQPNNKEFMIHFMEYASDVVVDTVMHHCQNISNLILKEINQNNKIEK